MITISRVQGSNHHIRLASGDPSVIYFINRLLCPVIAVSALALSLLIWGIPFAGPYIIVALFAFVGVADFLRLPNVKGRQSIFTALQFLLDTLIRWIMIFGVILAILYFTGVVDSLNADVLKTWVISTAFLLWAGQLAGLHMGLRRVPPRRAVVVGLTEMGIRLEQTLVDDPLMCTEVIGFFEDRSADRYPPGLDQRVLGRSASLPQFMANNHVDIIYITLPMTPSPRVLQLLEGLRDSTASIYFVPDTFLFNLVQARFDNIHGIHAVSVTESPFYGMHGISKRMCDLTVSFVCLLILAPLLMAIALGVRLTSKGPVLFKQARYGLDGKSIVVYKFRSMTVTEDGIGNYTQVSKNDSRVTPFGSFLRKTSLDELPQLLNVFEGSMSIVGPRPHAVAVNERYRQLIPSYMVRHKVKPGITGLAQVNGYRGGDDLEGMKKRIDFDLAYLSQWSMRLDLLIMLKTAALVVRDHKAY